MKHLFTLTFFFRKYLPCTSKYIYEKLFLDGENSDITITALGKEWKLHKIYLSQVILLFILLDGCQNVTTTQS